MACRCRNAMAPFLTIVLGLTMAVLDGAIANVALPTIASDLNASPAASIWIVNAYQIAIVIALLPLSFLGDMVGYRRIYKIGLVVLSLPRWPARCRVASKC